MYSIILADKEQHRAQIRDLFYEYLQWIDVKLIETYGFGIGAVAGDVASYVEDDLQHLDKFQPPFGRLLLCYQDERPVGMAAMKALHPGIGEIKRMYVRPAYRRQGIGRALLQRLLAEAAVIEYHCLRLDSAPFLGESHQLYRSVGFRAIAPYEGNEIPKEFQTNWLFMEKAPIGTP